MAAPRAQHEDNPPLLPRCLSGPAAPLATAGGRFSHSPHWSYLMRNAAVSLAVVCLLAIAGCRAAPQGTDTTAGWVPDEKTEAAASEFGTQLQSLAGSALGPLGYMATGFFLPIIWQFFKNTVKGTAAAAGTAVTSAAKTVGITTEAPKP